MSAKLGTYKCSKCDNPVHRKETVLCRACHTIKITGAFRVDREEKIKNRKKYKQEYYQKNKERIRLRRRSNPISKDKVFAYGIKSSYGLTVEEYNKMYIAQGEKCIICEKQFLQDRNNKPRIDHCHKAGNVRGLLCMNCNSGLGHFKDNTNILKRAIKYLENQLNNQSTNQNDT